VYQVELKMCRLACRRGVEKFPGESTRHTTMTGRYVVTFWECRLTASDQSHFDLFPTSEDACKIPKTELGEFDGKRMLRTMNGKKNNATSHTEVTLVSGQESEYKRLESDCCQRK